MCVHVVCSVCIPSPPHSQLGLMLSCDPTPCFYDNLSALLTRHTLHTAMGHTVTQALSSDDIAALMTMATRVEPVLVGGAEILLDGFYTGSRRVRGSDMPHTSLETM